MEEKDVIIYVLCKKLDKIMVDVFLRSIFHASTQKQISEYHALSLLSAHNNPTHWLLAFWWVNKLNDTSQSSSQPAGVYLAHRP
jgi:hypothetical protein